MCHGKLSRCLAVVLCSARVLTGTIQAGEASADATPLSVTLEQLPLRSPQPIYRAYLKAETGKFTFVIPVGFRLKGDPAEGKLKLSNLEGNCQITFCILDPAPCGSQSLNVDDYRDVVQARHPKGKIIEQLCPGAAGREGVGFDMRWETTNKFAQCARTAFVPSTAGLLEFSATSNPKDFSDLRYQLNQVMATFQATTPGGKLVVPKISPNDLDRSDAGSSRRRRQGQPLFWSGSAWSST